jgi:hypothetical protein
MTRLIIPEVTELPCTFTPSQDAFANLSKLVGPLNEQRHFKLKANNVVAEGLGHFEGQKLVVDKWIGEAEAAIAVGKFARMYPPSQECATHSLGEIAHSKSY